MSHFINKVVKTMMISDFFLNLGWGFLSPVFAIFILQNIHNTGPVQAAEIAGLSALFYWVPKSLLEIPIAIFLDKNHGEKDDYWFMVAGLFMLASVPIGYIFSTQPWHIYIFQVVYALGMAMALPSWMAIFTRHIDRGKEAFEWGMESSMIGLGAGIAGGLSGVMVAILGFKLLFVIVSAFTIFSGFVMMAIKKRVFYKDGHVVIFSGEKPIIEP